MGWKTSLQKGNEIILATCSNGKPRAIVVISLGLENGKLLIGACQMKTTLKNIRNSGRVSVVVMHDKEYYRIDGKAEIHASGRYFDVAVKRSEPPLPKHVVVITVKEVFDLDKTKKVF